jgi:hypothetical protein
MSVQKTIQDISRGKFAFPASLAWQRTAGARGLASWTLKTPLADYEPEVGQEEATFDSGVRVLSASIDRKVKTWRGQDGAVQFDLTSVTLEQRIDKHIITPRTYSSTNAGAIIADIMTQFAGSESIFLGTIDDGADIDSITYDFTPLGDAIKDLEDRSNCITVIDPEGFLHFLNRGTLPAPFTLTMPDVLKLGNIPTIKVTESRDDLRNTQYIRIPFECFAPYQDVLIGDGSQTDFTLSKPVNRIESVTLTDAVFARAVGTFTGVPAEGDVVQVGAAGYTFRATPDHRVHGDVLLGATVADCIRNLLGAINATEVNKGIAYSLPTWANFQAQVESFNDGAQTLTLRAHQLGSAGNNITISATSGAFSWDGANLAGGVDGSLSSQDFGVEDVDTDKQWFYKPGLATFKAAVAPEAGQQIVIDYRPIGSDVIGVRDDARIAARAAVENASGEYASIVEDQSITTAPSGLDKANALIDLYGDLKKVLEFQTDRPGLEPLQILTVDLDAPFEELNGDWLITDVNSTYTREGKEHFRYTVQCMAGQRQHVAPILGTARGARRRCGRWKRSAQQNRRRAR